VSTVTGIPQKAMVIAVAANTVTVNVNSTGFDAFTYPTSAQVATGITFPQIYAIGDQNSGMSGLSAIPPITGVITIPGAYYTNTRKGVIIGIGNGTQIMHANGDVVRWRAILPDQLQTS
jgi:hypothetical protein